VRTNSSLVVVLTFSLVAKGYLSVSTAQSLFAKLAPHLSPEVVAAVVNEADTDGDGRITMRDFDRIVNLRGAPLCQLRV